MDCYLFEQNQLIGWFYIFLSCICFNLFGLICANIKKKIIVICILIVLCIFNHLINVKNIQIILCIIFSELS